MSFFSGGKQGHLHAMGAKDRIAGENIVMALGFVFFFPLFQADTYFNDGDGMTGFIALCLWPLAQINTGWRSIGSLIALTVGITVLAAPVWAASIRCSDDGDGGGACLWGRAEGVEGGSVRIRGFEVHLMGITPPQRRELCGNKVTKDEFDCARPARRRMIELLAKGVACDLVDMVGDKLYGRCRVADGDLARLLVASGVVRSVKDGPYDAEQVTAQTAHRGLWSPDYSLPRDWDVLRRKGDKADSAQAPSPASASAPQ